jgi:hypothetical protein
LGISLQSKLQPPPFKTGDGDFRGALVQGFTSRGVLLFLKERGGKRHFPLFSALVNRRITLKCDSQKPY